MDISGVMRAESSLRAAILAADMERLEALFSEQALVVDCDGTARGRSEKLELYREGTLKRTVLDIDVELVVARNGLAVTVVYANVAGSLAGSPFEGQFVYTRTWVESADGWRVLSAVCRRAS